MILWIIESRMKRDEIELEISVKELYSTLLIVLSAFMLSNLSFVYRNTPFSGSIATDIFYDPDAGGFWRAYNPVCLSEPTA